MLRIFLYYLLACPLILEMGCLTVFGQETPLPERLLTEADTLPNHTFHLFPILSYTQETSLQLGAFGLYSFYTDHTDALTRNSSLSLTLLYTLEKQAIINARSEIWSKTNKWHYSGEMSYRYFPFYFYGIGAATALKDQELLTEQYFSFQLSAERQVAGPYYLGLKVGLDSYQYHNENAGGLYQNDPNIIGKSGGDLISVELIQAYDSRNNTVYPTKGAFVRISTGYAPTIWGKDNYQGTLLSADLRKFKSLLPTLVIGLHATYKSYPSGQVPFYLLPRLGNDQLMRGYYAGRFRDQQLLAFQTELRYRFTSQLGVVGFLGAGMVYGQENISRHALKPSYGIGFRYFIDPKQGLSIRLDYGIGQQLPGEKRQTGFYFSLGESF